MAYCTTADCEFAAGSALRLVELTDDLNSGSLNTTVLTAAVTAATAWIDSYAGPRFATSFITVPSMVTVTAAAEVVYLLKERRGMADDNDRAARALRLEWLRDVARGVVNPGADPVPAKSASMCPEVLTRDEDEDISRASLEGFW